MENQQDRVQPDFEAQKDDAIICCSTKAILESLLFVAGDLFLCLCPSRKALIFP